MHKRFAGLLAISLLFIGAAQAQPVIESPAVSAASYRSPGMPGSGVAQGSIFFTYGTGLGPNSLLQAYTFPLPTKLGGTSVTVTVGGTQVSAIMLYTVSSAIAAILPSTTPVGKGSFTITYNGQTSAPADIQVVSSAFGIFTVNSQGAGQASATDIDYLSNSIIHTFHPGDYVTLWGTGLGAINGSDAGVPPFGNIGTVTVYVGNTTASNVTYYGRSGYAGLDQIDFQIPAGLTGCYVPVAVQAGPTLGNIGNFPTIAISASGQTCSDSVMGQDLVNQLAAGQTVDFGYIRLESWIAKYVPGSEANATEDFGFATFSEYTPGAAGLAQYGVSSGYCAAVDCSTLCGGANQAGFSLSDSSPAQLDAGAVTVEYAPAVPLSQSQGQPGFYSALLSGENGRYLYSALTYPLAGTGGAAVGAFSVNDFTSIPTATLTGLQNTPTVPVSGDLTLQWTGGDPTLANGQLTISAQSYSQTGSNTYQYEVLQCTAPVAAQKFTIPAWVLSALPPSGTFSNVYGSYPGGWIQIGQYNKPTSFTATGLTSGIVTDIFYNGVGVNFQ
jgi:uncharacterized protein (TIGR03437 family)